METRNPRELGPKGSFLVGTLLAVMLSLVVASVVVWRGRKIEEAKKARTEETLRLWAQWMKFIVPAPRADGSGLDWMGLAAFEERDFAPGPVPPREDGWGNPIRYRCPGPVHKKGWDFYSCGPNGKDDAGTFDDVLVGEDLAPVTTGQ